MCIHTLLKILCFYYRRKGEKLKVVDPGVTKSGKYCVTEAEFLKNTKNTKSEAVQNIDYIYLFLSVTAIQDFHFICLFEISFLKSKLFIFLLNGVIEFSLKENCVSN